MIYDDLSFLGSISIEIGLGCNLSQSHTMCPAHCLERDNKDCLSDDQIISILDQANSLKFNGYFAFHFYNEPLLHIERIDRIIKQRPNYKYLLWSNGTLIKRTLDLGYSFEIFDRIVFTKYDESDIDMMNHIKSIHSNTEIYDADMDERLNFYENDTENYFTCKKVYLELPIDYSGKAYICTFDWNGEYIIGDLQKQTLEEVFKSETYQNILKENKGRLRHGSTVELCKKCTRPCLELSVII